MIKPLPVEDNAVSIGRIWDYLSHPYLIWKSSNVVRITIV